MRIGIIGAGLAGLTAGKVLSKAGHEVTLFERQHGTGGKLTSYLSGQNDNLLLDHGLSWLTAEKPEFRGLISELIDRGLLRVWGEKMWQHDGQAIKRYKPDWIRTPMFAAPAGLASVAEDLSRWVDIHTKTKAAGLTFIGAGRRKKRPWMINLTSFDTFEVDAVIIATSAPEAYGLLMTTQDETETLKVIREIDEITFQPGLTLMAHYEENDPPQWDALICDNPVIRQIVNENSKRDLPGTALVVQTTADFAKSWVEDQEQQPYIDNILNHLGGIAGNWAITPDWAHLRYWKFFQGNRFLDRPYFENERDEAPVGVIGDYFEGNLAEHAYRSGYKLAQDWVKKYPV